MPFHHRGGGFRGGRGGGPGILPVLATAAIVGAAASSNRASVDIYGTKWNEVQIAVAVVAVAAILTIVIGFPIMEKKYKKAVAERNTSL